MIFLAAGGRPRLAGRVLGVLALLFFCCAAQGEIFEDKRAIKQKQLDEACELARERKLAPLRKKFVAECVEKQKKKRDYCEEFYSDYGVRTGNRPPLFYDLPECVTAFDFRNEPDR